MTKRLSNKLSSDCQISLAVIAVSLLSGLVNTSLIRAQSSHASGAVPLSFEVASIKPSAPDPPRSGISTAPSGRVTLSAMSVTALTRFAYGAKVTTSGGPGWVDSEQFDITAKVDDSLVAGWDQMPELQRDKLVEPMIRSLLEDRFKLTVRTEPKEQPVYARMCSWPRGPRCLFSYPG